jgi:hypothetical protein
MSSSTLDVRHGDRITALAGRARSAHTRKPLTRSCYLDVLHVYPQHDGTVEVYAMELTKRDGAWRTGGPDRTVILTAESYTTPIREGDTVHCVDPHRVATVTTIHLAYEDGHITVDLLFADGVTSTVNLATLTHVTRAPETAAEPVLRLGHRDAEPMPPATGAQTCWNDLCIATDCDGINHVDATGDTWTQRCKAADSRGETRYAVRWHVAGDDRPRSSNCAVLHGYSTVDDIPIMIAIRDGVPVDMDSQELIP